MAGIEFFRGQLYKQNVDDGPLFPKEEEEEEERV
jgi:hypothetical protein